MVLLGIGGRVLEVTKHDVSDGYDGNELELFHKTVDEVIAD